MLANRIWQAIKSFLYDRTTPVQVVNAAYTTSASARPQVLSNGWIVTAVQNGTTDFKFHVSKDGGATFAQLTYFSHGTTSGGFSLTSNGTNIIFIATNDYDRLYIVKFDALTVTNTNRLAQDIDTVQTGVGGCSIAVNSTGTLTAAWSSKNATYPNSFNIRSAKSTDGGVTWTKQDGTAGVDQITTNNLSNMNSIQPCVIYASNGNVVIIYNFDDNYNGARAINFVRFTTVWSSASTLFNNGSYAQSSPSATVQKYGANAGRIEVVWHGLDATDNAVENIRYSYSDDSGVSWQTSLKLTSGNNYEQYNPSVSADLTGDLFVMFEGFRAGYSSYTNIRLLKKTSGTWGTIQEITSSNTNFQEYASSCNNYYDFEKPLTIWSNRLVDVKFYGRWNWTP